MLNKKSIVTFVVSLVLSGAMYAQPKPVSGVAANDIQAKFAESNGPACPKLASLRTLPTNQTLFELYQRRDFVAQWQAPEVMAALRHELLKLADDGLILGDYSYALNAEPAAEACDELRISSEYLLALEHLSRGRMSQASFQRQWHDAAVLPARPSNLVDLALSGLQNVQTAFDGARPALPLYRELRIAYRQMDKQPAAQQTIPSGLTIKPDREDPRIPMLVQRLQAEGYLAKSRDSQSETGPLRYEEDIEEAIIHFQADHGLQADGVVGEQTLDALNISPLQRLDQVRINLERLRWLDSQRNDYMLLVNIAGGDIWLYRGQEIIWQSKVMSGRPERPTPALISRINRITLNPSWTVPPTIFKEDKLPQIRRNPTFLQQNNLQVMDTQGRAIDPEKVNWNNPVGIMLRQPPGPSNPLGKIALRFQNPFSIYLHDTPSQNLFEKSARNVSSGCVRVQDVAGLASHLLAEKSETELKQIALLQESGKTHEITLSNGPQLVISYWTAETASNGRVKYLRDPYNMDHALMSAFGELDTAYRTLAQKIPARVADVCSR